MDCQARSARRLFWGFGWDDLRPRRFERTNGIQVPFSGGSQWSSEMSHNEKNILHISNLSLCLLDSVRIFGKRVFTDRSGGRMIRYQRC